ncbi:hypothetical protein Pdis01_01133 [Parabacteroides distasonis]|nr:hypothetical protein HMPREF1000_02931 [Parabacteroides sp. D26]CUP77199.1 Uncharacterised protein [Parabacteroides distasonis]
MVGTDFVPLPELGMQTHILLLTLRAGLLLPCW